METATTGSQLFDEMESTTKEYEQDSVEGTVQNSNNLDVI